jgi:hypothetical protein
MTLGPVEEPAKVTPGLLRHAPSSLRDVKNQCAAVEAWAQRCDSVPGLLEVTDRLAAIDDHLARCGIEGRARLAAAMRCLEMRVFELSARSRRF